MRRIIAMHLRAFIYSYLIIRVISAVVPLLYLYGACPSYSLSDIYHAPLILSGFNIINPAPAISVSRKPIRYNMFVPEPPVEGSS